MIESEKPPEELARVTELHGLCVLDTLPEERFDRLTRIAQRLFGVNIALVSLIDHDRLWFKSRQGFDVLQAPRNISFCAHAILSDAPLVVEDAELDARFSDNPLVTGPLGFRFYAGTPLHGPKGYRVGTLCLIDQNPRQFTSDDADALRDLAAVVSDQLANKELGEAVKAAKESESRLRQITDTVPALIAYRDRDQRFIFHNKAYEELLNMDFEQIHGRTIAELVSPQAYGPVHDKAEEVLRGCHVRYERTYITGKGENRIYDMQYFPRYGEGADATHVIGFFSLGADITELKRIDRMKTEFISTVSHELRSPLTSIRGSLGLIAAGIAGELPEAAKNLVEIANNNCERLIRLINDILDSEKIESGKMRLELTVVNMAQLAQQAMLAHEGFAKQHDVKLVLQAPDASLQASVDSDRLVQVLTNLLSNAVKFSPPDGTVTVNVLRVAQGVRVEVVDCGTGIPDDFRDRIFQKFSQADASDSREKGGTGLGLNISQALIHKMGGQIGFSSEVGAGSTFFFELPEWQTPEPAVQLLFSDAPSALRQPRILICESDPDVALLISMMLEKAGFGSEMVHDTPQAQDRVLGGNFVAITVDLNLTGSASFINALHSDERTRHLPVVAISAMAGEGCLQFNQKLLTVSDWLEKPIDESRLVQSVCRAVAGSKGPKPRILHVEDDPDIQSIVAAIVRDSAEFEFSATLGEARARLRENSFDLILLDLALGEDSGWSLFDDIDKLKPRPPVIVFSASDKNPEQGSQVEAVLVKSNTSNTELLHAIERALLIPEHYGNSGKPERIYPKNQD
ncbi:MULTISPECIES: ATP-binding protein [unclassified Polaromonas]|uniref:ATP-binding protein n=1 Tax=unclassified Polaromonas TaxID=2638319 RepID=UPI0018C8E21A|nr:MULTISPECIES: ATP-binding protein [unclassified Polaromonas]MBG6070394.1 PAS domain S-box-containing protein [Polaromonas sp. CG_9.7]MBG6112392.1 PAS domain S-box-containing protein [Polaromonas sp. CG_9.2]MDH6184039.1 PAS domain S-box-containing protein [Polaromonas sp. CG_23.6]